MRCNAKLDFKCFPMNWTFRGMFLDARGHFLIQGLRGSEKGHRLARVFSKLLRVRRFSTPRPAKDKSDMTGICWHYDNFSITSIEEIKSSSEKISSVITPVYCARISSSHTARTFSSGIKASER